MEDLKARRALTQAEMEAANRVAWQMGEIGKAGLNAR